MLTFDLRFAEARVFRVIVQETESAQLRKQHQHYEAIMIVQSVGEQNKREAHAWGVNCCSSN